MSEAEARSQLQETYALDSDKLGRIEAYLSLLRNWNKAVQLVGAKELDRLWSRHVADSMRLIPFLEKETRVVDLGSGSGFPGLLNALVTDIPHQLVESDRRKASFLSNVSRELGIPAEILPERLEALDSLQAACVTARALAPLPKLMFHVEHHLSANGRALLMKGQAYEEEIEAARVAGWKFHVKPHQSPSGIFGPVLEISQIRRF